MNIDTNMRRGRRIWMLLCIPVIAICLPLIFTQSTQVVQARQSSAVPALAQASALRFVDSQNAPIANDTIWVLCYADEQATTFVSDLLLTTDANGNPLQPLPAGCQWIAALHRQFEQPSGKPGHGHAYRVYAASWRTGSGAPEFDAPGCSFGVPNCAIARQPSGDVVIRKEWPLVLFNVVASLEWNPEPGSSFVKELRNGLKYASLYLADLTDGYMAIGPVTIHRGGRNWDGADLRFQTANDLRPAAFIGGIVPSTQLYTSPLEEQSAIFRPAAAFYGRYWNGVNAHTGAWHLADAYRTLIHEWAHYALFLYDEYGYKPGRQGAIPTYCVCDDLPKLIDPATSAVCGDVTRENGASAMAYHYTASELWHPIHGNPQQCANSDQSHFHGEPDWATLSNWFTLQNISGTLNLPTLDPPAAPLPGPTVLPVDGPTADVFGQGGSFQLFVPNVRLPGPPIVPAIYTSTLQVQLSDTASPTETLVSQVYLMQHDTGGNEWRNVHQGTLTGAPVAPVVGQIDLWGITPGNRLHVFVDRYETASTTGARFLYVSAPNEQVQTLQTVTAAENIWGSNLDLVYSTTVASGDVPGLLTGVTVVLFGEHNMDFATPPRAQICVPDAKVGCPAAWNKAMQMDNSGNWVATFAPFAGADELPLYGVVRIVSAQRRTDGLIRWFRDAGGVGPGHKIGNTAPLRDGPVMVDRVTEPALEPECNRVMVMPAANYYAMLSPSDTEAIIGTPLDLDILLGDAVDGVCASSGIDELEEFSPLRLTLFYTEEAVQRLGISDESQLRIVQYVPSAEEWTQLASTVDSELNRISARITEDGIYAIGWYP